MSQQENHQGDSITEELIQNDPFLNTGNTENPQPDRVTSSAEVESTENPSASTPNEKPRPQQVRFETRARIRLPQTCYEQVRITRRKYVVPENELVEIANTNKRFVVRFEISEWMVGKNKLMFDDMFQNTPSDGVLNKFATEHFTRKQVTEGLMFDTSVNSVDDIWQMVLERVIFLIYGGAQDRECMFANMYLAYDKTMKVGELQYTIRTAYAHFFNVNRLKVYVSIFTQDQGDLRRLLSYGTFWEKEPVLDINRFKSVGSLRKYARRAIWVANV